MYQSIPSFHDVPQRLEALCSGNPNGLSSTASQSGIPQIRRSLASSHIRSAPALHQHKFATLVFPLSTASMLSRQIIPIRTLVASVADPM